MYLHNDSSLTAKDFFTYGDDHVFEANNFWKIPLAFNDKRHVERIEANIVPIQQTWRMKERMKTVSVALVLCLNVGVDPPDLIKTSPCARLQCWKDPNLLAESLPTSTSNLGAQQKPIDVIGAALQKQYERWQPRARYKLTLDPTLDDVKKLCLSLRRNAKDERVLLHYNGHGVPRPTGNGEIWVFNKHYTQYIPLSVIDLQTWMGRPSIYVFDCSNAGHIVDYLTASIPPFKSDDIEISFEETNKNGCFYENILLISCKKDELLPMNAILPADLFTSCLTTPIKIGVRWFILTQSSVLVPDLTIDDIEKIPGQLNDRRTMLGELNWIFTAITDTIAWNQLPRELFQKLFRQDLLVASLFRNFLLAERIMRSYNCTPISFPELPNTHNHPMWQAWDMALDNCLLQLSSVLKNLNSYQHSNFFTEQLTAFQVWLDCASDRRNPPEQLPIVLQVLLSQIHRHRALELLGKFLDLGQWAVNLALSVGIFPYVLKLLQSSARELRPLLIFIWVKLLAVDSSCQADLVKDNGHKYFLSVLSDPYMPSEQRMMAAFILSMIMNDYPIGQEVALKDNVISLCLDQLYDPNPMLRQWVLLCLAKTWTNFDDARWYGVRDNAHDQIFSLLADEIAEVRTSAVYALGKFISNGSERNDQVIKLDQSIATSLLATTLDASPMVRKELIISLIGFVLRFESQFVAVCLQMNEDEVNREYHTITTGGGAFANQNKFHEFSGLKKSTSFSSLKDEIIGDSLKRISSSSVMGSSMTGGSAVEKVWKTLIYLSNDCFTDVAITAKKIINYVKSNTKLKSSEEPLSFVRAQRIRKSSAPLSNLSSSPTSSSSSGPHMPRGFGSNPRTPDRSPVSQSESTIINSKDIEKLESNFFKWACNYFSEPLTRTPDHMDPQGKIYFEREYRYIKADKMLKIAQYEQNRSKYCKCEELIFSNKQNEIPRILRFHPYETQLAVAEISKISIWDWEQGTKVSTLMNQNPKLTRITSMDFVNAHDDALLMIGTDDSAVRIWKHYCNPDRTPHMLTAWWTLSDMIPVSKGSGLVLEFDAMSGHLFASGDAKYIRIWDVNRETKIQDMPTLADSSITSLSLEKSAPVHPKLIIGSCADGKVQVFDTRLKSINCVVRTFHKHTSMVIRANTLQRYPNNVISASSKGEIMIWDFRNNNVIHTMLTPVNITSIDAHPNAEIIACGTIQSGVLTYNHDGEMLVNIKQHHSFIGSRFGSVACLSFHPIKVRLAIAREDMTVSVYNLVENKKK